MLQYFMKDGFRLGISNYLKKYAYSNAETKDLWEELSNTSESGINITEVMDTWTRQMGFPYVEVTRNEEGFLVKQQRYVHDTKEFISKTAHKSPYGYIWKIPLTFKNLDTGEEYSFWLNEQEAIIPHNITNDSCYKFNPNFIGYYIVKYDDIGWYALSRKLQRNHEVFPVTDRYSLLFDAILLVEEDLLMYDVVLELTKYLKNEKNANPWQIVGRKLFLFVSKRLRPDSEAKILWQAYISYLTDDLYEDIPKNETKLSDFQETIITLACSNNNKKCVKNQTEELEKWLQGERTSDMRMFKTVLPHHGNKTIWNEIWLRFNEQNSSSTEYSALAFGLTQFHDETLLEKTIASILWHEDLPQYIIDRSMSNIVKNSVGVRVLWKYMKQNWSIFSAKVDANDPGCFEHVIHNLGSKFKTEHDLQDLKEVLKRYPDAVSLENQNAIFKRIEFNIKWLKNNEETITTWLRWNLADKELT